MKNYPVFTLLALTTFFVFGAQPVHADTYGSYGNNTPVPNNLTINKVIKNPQNGLYVENLGSNDTVFIPGSLITFHLTIRNDSGETFQPVEVVDQLPSYLTFVSSSIPVLSYDAGAHRVVFRIENIIAGDTKTIAIVARVADASAFPTNSGIICTSNYSKVTAPARPNGDDDTAEFCLARETQPAITTLPVAGYNDIFALIPFLSLGGIGMMLMKKRV